jgi:hypothetical protein
MGRTFSLLRVLFIALIVVSALLVLTNLLVAATFGIHLSDGLQSSYDTYSLMVEVNNTLVLLALIISIGGGVCLIVWTRRAFIVSQSAPVVQAARKYSRGMAVAWWFIPIGNLFMPKKVISEIERSLKVAADTTEYSGDWNLRPVERKGTLWWVLFVVGALLGSGSSLSETDAQGFLKEDVVYQNAFGSAISRAFIVVSLFFGISYLRQVTKLAEKLENTQRSSGSSTD